VQSCPAPAPARPLRTQCQASPRRDLSAGGVRRNGMNSPLLPRRSGRWRHGVQPSSSQLRRAKSSSAMAAVSSCPTTVPMAAVGIENSLSAMSCEGFSSPLVPLTSAVMRSNQPSRELFAPVGSSAAHTARSPPASKRCGFCPFFAPAGRAAAPARVRRFGLCLDTPTVCLTAHPPIAAPAPPPPPAPL